MPNARNHLLITERLAVQGTVSPMVGRLGDHLRSHAHPFMRVTQARVRFWGETETSEVAEIYLPLERIILAHEYVDLGSDPHLRAVHVPPTRERVKIVTAGLNHMTVDGDLSEATDTEWHNRFVALLDPEWVFGPSTPSALRELCEGLPWILVNRDRIEALVKP